MTLDVDDLAFPKEETRRRMDPNGTTPAPSGKLFRRETIGPDLLRFAILLALYVAAGKLGLSFAFRHRSASPVWPPTGIALAALILWGYRFWPAILVGAFIVNITTPGTVITSLGIALGNTLEGLSGAYLANRFARGRDAFLRPQDIVRWTFFAGLLATGVSATIGLTTLSLAGFSKWEEFDRIWLTWWMGDAAGALVVAPFLLIWERDYRLGWTRRAILEGSVFLVAMLTLGALAFGVPIRLGPRTYPIPFVFPILAWVAFRLGPRATATAVVLLSTLAIWGTLKGHGGFAGREPNESLLLLQIFMAVSAATALAVAAAIQERRRAQEEKAQLNRTLEVKVEERTRELKEAVGQLEAFSHTVAHDLRAPLRALHGYSEIILSEIPASEGLIRDAATRLVASAGKMDRLIQDLLDFTRITRVDMPHEPVSLDEVAREALEHLAGEVTERQAEVTVRSPLPRVLGHRATLVTVLQNLVSNALKFMPPGQRPKVVIRGEPNGRLERVWVEDNGIGIAPEYQERIFGVFQRLHTEAYAGTGMGLAIVKKALERMGGRTGVESELGKGSRFWIEVPLANPTP